MEYLRTPDERFADLPGWLFPPRYVGVPDGDGGVLRVHYVDEGPAGGEPVLLLHGEPSWSDSDPITAGADRILRKLIPGAVGQPHTVIAGAGHFLQEDKGAELGATLVEFVTRS